MEALFGKGGDITLSTDAAGFISDGPFIATGGDIYGQFSPHTGNGGNGGLLSGNAGNSGMIGNNGFAGGGGSFSGTTADGAFGSSINNAPGIYVQGGAITPLQIFRPNFVSPYFPSAPQTGNGGNGLQWK